MTIEINWADTSAATNSQATEPTVRNTQFEVTSPQDLELGKFLDEHPDAPRFWARLTGEVFPYLIPKHLHHLPMMMAMNVPDVRHFENMEFGVVNLPIYGGPRVHTFITLGKLDSEFALDKIIRDGLALPIDGLRDCICDGYEKGGFLIIAKDKTNVHIELVRIPSYLIDDMQGAESVAYSINRNA